MAVSGIGVGSYPLAPESFAPEGPTFAFSGSLAMRTIP